MLTPAPKKLAGFSTIRQNVIAEAAMKSPNILLARRVSISGDVRLFGYDPFVHRAEVMRRARFAFAPPAVYGSLTAREHLHFLSATGVQPRERSTHGKIMAVLETVGLADRADDKAHTYSFGMKQRLNLAQALLPKPALLIFDEPTDGLDPIAVMELRCLLKRLKTEHNLTLVLSSHLLGEIEKLVDIIFMLNDSRHNPDDLRIVTWNVGGAGSPDGRSLDNRFLSHVATVLKELDAYLIMLPEIAYEKQVSRLSRSSPI